MLKIAICNDISAELSHAAGLTKAYLAEAGIDAAVLAFSHPDALLSACETKTFHIFLLDMVMPMISGLELGRNIRRVSTDAQIIYITAEPSFALDAYSVNPLHYLLKPVDPEALFRETLMQWLFNCLTAMNVYAVTVILSYYLCDLFTYPHYAMTFLRFTFFAGAIWLFRSRLRFLYRQAAEHWNLYLCVAAGLFTNFAWYFIASEDMERTLTENTIPLLLLIALGTLVYAAIFICLKNNLREAALQEENMKIQSDRELTRQRLSQMDETVRQVSIAQHDRRHFNNTLLSMLRQGCLFGQN